jgi:hypothetical protein
MDKSLIDRRVEQMAAEGVTFRTEVEIGADLAMRALIGEFDAVATTGGAELPRDLEVPGRALDGIHFAMDYLPQQNKRNAGDGEARAAPAGAITAASKHVVVIGGGDTGSPHLLVAGGGVRAQLGGIDQAGCRQQRACRRTRMRAHRLGQGRRQPLDDGGNPWQCVHLAGRSRVAGDGLSRSEEDRHGRAIGRCPRSGGQRPG